MCGIVGFTGKNNAAAFLLDGLQKLEYRGYDSAGIAVLGDGNFDIQKTVGRIKSLKDKTENGNTVIGNIGIGHTRWATHGVPSIENAHPHSSENGLFAVVHNGIIENYVALKEELKSEGVKFVSETDTEVVPHLLAKYYNGDIKSTLKKVLSMLEGSFALGIICKDYPDTLIAAKKFSPLIIGLSKNSNIIASDVTAIASVTKDIVYLEDGEFAFLTPNGATFFDSDANEINKSISKITWDVSAAEKGGFEHFMMKEIFEQPKSVSQTVNGRIKNGNVVFEDFKLTAEKLTLINKIFIVACGSAYHAGMVGKYVIEDMARIPCDVELASEFRYRNPIVDEKTLTIVISQSGETADTLAALNEAKRLGSHTISVVNVVGSSIAKASDDVIYTWAGPEIAVATTKGYSTQVAVMYLFAAWCAKALGTMKDSEIADFLQEVKSIPEKIEEVLLQKDKLKEMAKKQVNTSSLFFIGRNLDYAISLEASLKLKEISYIHSEAYAAGELKHGTISLIEDGVTVIALSCYKDLTDKTLSNIKEVKARGAFVITCTQNGDTDFEKESDEMIYIPKIDKRLIASLEVIPFQIYSYYVSYHKGLDIDKPRNLAKSVTVE
ncbi:MAG: glutamine--fructose-6-phosphate transaminase (isomerizing) [Clostridia bacterium]|nr:glutamine--fructose-6-phosphate transaminase (isomerizing) [Clostridia bacterium]